MSNYTENYDIPKLEWEPIWSWKPVNPDCIEQPGVELIPPDEVQTLWRVPVEMMHIGTTYKARGHANISIEVVHPKELGLPHMNLRTSTLFF